MNLNPEEREVARLDERQMVVRNVLIVAVSVVLLMGGIVGCHVVSSRECNSTKREALKGDDAARLLVLAERCL
jgi:hypothetical protein